MKLKHPNLSTFGYHYKSTRARELSFVRELEEVLNPLMPSGGKPGVCGPDSIAQSLGMSAVTVHNRIQAFMHNEQNKERLQPLSHMTSEEWDELATGLWNSPPPGAGVRPRRTCANYAAGAMKQ